MLSHKRSRSLHSPKYLEKKRKKIVGKTLIYFLCGAAALILIILFLRLGFLQIKSAQVGGATSLNSNDIEKIVSAQLEGNYLFVIPKSNTFFYPKHSIEQAVKDSFKKIETLEVSRASFSKLSLNISERMPSAVVCEGFHGDDDENQDCYFVDPEGYVYEKSPRFSEGVYQRYYISTTTDQEIIGSAFITPVLFKELQTFLTNAGKSSIAPIGLFVGENGNYELYVKNSDESEAVVYFDDRQPFDKTLSNFVTFWKDALQKKKNASSTPVFEYIDLRYGNNIFYATK